MRKRIVFLALLVIAGFVNANAQDSEDIAGGEYQEASADGEDFSDTGGFSMLDEEFLVSEFSGNIYQGLLQHNMSYTVNGVEINDNCAAFITEQASLGSHGRFIVQHLASNSSQYSRLMGNGAMRGVCGRYSTLDNQQRAVLWTLIMTTMAHFESQCSVSSANTGAPNGTAQGFFQLHLGSEHRYPSSNNACTRNVSLNAQGSVQCALGMLDHQLGDSGQLFTNGSYWDVLRPNGNSVRKQRAIERAITNSSLCRDNSI